LEIEGTLQQNHACSEGFSKINPSYPEIQILNP